MVENLNKNLIPISIIVAALIIAGTIIFVSQEKGEEVSLPVTVEEIGPAAVAQPKTEPPAREEPQAEEPSQASLEAFAKCLTQKGAKFYGASWCGWCNRQKQLFGEAAKYLPYIECSDPETRQLTSVCQEAGITGFPTWEFNGEKSPGFKLLEQLAKLSGCSL